MYKGFSKYAGIVTELGAEEKPMKEPNLGYRQSRSHFVGGVGKNN